MPNFSKMFTKRSDGYYRTTYTDSTGKIKYLYDKDPKALYEKLQNAKKPQPITFGDAAVAWEREYREHCNVRTWMNYKPHYESILDKFADTDISCITGVDIIQDLQRAKAMGYSRTVVNTRRTIYNNVLNFSVAQGWIPYNICNGIPLPKGLPSSTRSAPTDEQIQIILRNYDKPFGLFPMLLLCTGLRKGEALALTRDDIKDGEISVTKSLTLLDGQQPKVKEPKSKAGIRSVPILSILKGPLDEHMSKLDGNILFPAQAYNGHPGGGYMSESNYDTAWANYVKSVGLDGLTAHQLRHGTATLLYEAGVDVHTARKILGHSNVNVTMGIYTELREAKEKQSVKKLNTYLTKKVQKRVQTPKSD